MRARSNQYSSINFLGEFIVGISIVNFCGRFPLLFLVAGKASRVLVDRWTTSETFHDVQNANSHCTGHATMSTERGNYLLITVRAPFLAIDRAKPKNPFAIVVWKLLVTERGMENSGDVLHGILLKNTVPTRVKHCAFIALQKFYSDHCLKRFCEFPGIFRFRFFSKKTNPHSLQQSS